MSLQNLNWFSSYGNLGSVLAAETSLERPFIVIEGGMPWRFRCLTQPFPAGGWGGGGGGALSLPAEPRRQMHFGNNGLKTGLWVAHELDPTTKVLLVGLIGPTY